jgi:hypothetical protein
VLARVRQCVATVCTGRPFRQPRIMRARSTVRTASVLLLARRSSSARTSAEQVIFGATLDMTPRVFSIAKYCNQAIEGQDKFGGIASCRGDIRILACGRACWHFAIATTKPEPAASSVVSSNLCDQSLSWGFGKFSKTIQKYRPFGGR